MPFAAVDLLARVVCRVRAAADWLEAALESGEFTFDDQLARLLKGE
ncbi:DUF6192 family protein [Streptomyces anulatus]|nr:DUF6192 family protein [Streptomyces anulatus]MCX4482394.1 DUF6192 family protein [Streptomyces anulatus]